MDSTSPVIATPIHRADFPSLVNIQGTILDQLVARSASGSELAFNVQNTEAAVADLAAAVRASDLTIKEVLATALADFAVDARNAGRGLQRLSGKIHATVDSITSYNTYTLSAIKGAKAGGATEIDATVLCTFQASMNTFSSQITRIIVDATSAMSALDRLDDRLAFIHELCTQEASINMVALDTLLWDLWTVLGGNHDHLRNLRRRVAVLQEVKHYCVLTVAYVSAASQTLYAVDTELSELRKRLTGYDLEEASIPVEVHLASIERSVRRLQNRKASGNGQLDSAT